MTALTRNTLALIAALALAGPAVAHAQTTVVDEGTFRLHIRDTPVGTETFTIRRSGSGAGAATAAQGRVVLDSGERTRSLLRLEGPDLRPAAYQIEVTGPETQSVTGQAAGNRFRATIVSAAGEQMREFLVSDGAVILGEGVAHPHYFLLSATNGDGSVPVVIPQRSRQVTAQVTSLGNDQIRVGRQSVDARRFRVEPEGLPTRIVWADARNRVLRVDIPDQEFRAIRTSLP
ncbi:MAG: hypothetical protein ACOC3J_05945 [Gemmatimonadota bacterium]